MKTILIFSLLGLSINLTFSQNNNSQDSLVWENLKTASLQIGFDVFHAAHDYSSAFPNELNKREKNSPPDEEVYYFELKKEWAQTRIKKWATQHDQPINNFLILFDVAQKSSLEKEKDEMVSNYQGFILIDLTDTINLSLQEKEKNTSTITIQSDGENALMENFLWREFMTHRLGRYNPMIQFDLIGKEHQMAFEQFKSAFLAFQRSQKN